MTVGNLTDADLARVRAALPGYEIGGQIGRGGCGVVLAGIHRGLNRRVAIKQIPPQFADDMQVRRRFVAEAQIMAALDHPHVVPVYDYVEHDDMCLLVLEYLPGGTVENRFITAGFEATAALAVALSCAAGLDAAHRGGILHRDVKPSNLMFAANGALKLTDFGIAKIVGGDETLVTRAGEIIGTPSYIAPEQVRGQQLSPATDVYALATMLYQLLSGVLPFPPGSDALAMLFAHAYGDPVPLTEVAPFVPHPIAEAVMRGLAPDPADRYDTAEIFGIALAEPAAHLWGANWLTPVGIPVIGADTIVAAATGGSRGARGFAQYTPQPGSMAPGPLTPPPGAAARGPGTGRPTPGLRSGPLTPTPQQRPPRFAPHAATADSVSREELRQTPTPPDLAAPRSEPRADAPQSRSGREFFAPQDGPGDRGDSPSSRSDAPRAPIGPSDAPHRVPNPQGGAVAPGPPRSGSRSAPTQRADAGLGMRPALGSPAPRQGGTVPPGPVGPGTSSGQGAGFGRGSSPRSGDAVPGGTGRQAGAQGNVGAEPGNAGAPGFAGAGARNVRAPGFSGAGPMVAMRPKEPIRHGGARLAEVARADLVPVRKVVTLPSPRVPFLAASILAVVTGAAAVLGFGAADRNVPPAGMIRIGGVDPAAGTVDLDLSKPVPITVTGADADAAKLSVEVLGVRAGGQSATLRNGMGEISAPVNRYVLAGQLTGELVLSRNGSQTAAYRFAMRTNQRSTTTATAVGILLLLLFAGAYAESNARTLRRGSARFASTVGLAISTGLLGAAAVGAAWVLLGHEPTVLGLIACAAGGVATGLALATGCRRVGKRYRYVRIQRLRERA
ncbi:protein kinase [Nocardia sp. ET3-3]|uniref:non-specific serine/threonine protein kinase n=1 Tax=Nocardia terrae TaxID=2675851 RepID=A0A7K1UPS3_9NOCA|nr:serine/threonine-protein kinase [Nocardia terrae]MVU76169.1 protein kinase [Nocardia terrae]